MRNMTRSISQWSLVGLINRLPYAGGVWIIISDRYAILCQQSTREPPTGDPLGRGNLKTRRGPIRMPETEWNRGGVWTSSFWG